MPGTCCPSTVNESMVAVPCIDSTRDDGPPKLIFSIWHLVSQAVSLTVLVAWPFGKGGTLISRRSPLSSSTVSVTPSVG